MEKHRREWLRKGRVIVVAAAASASLVVAARATDVPPPVSQPEGTQTELGSAFISNAHQLTTGYQRAGEGYFSPDGRKLIFQAEAEAANPFFQIFVMDLGTGEANRVSPGIGKTTCAFFRGNTGEVEFASTHLDGEAVKKQQEEIAFRESGGKRHMAWDYDPHMDIFAAYTDGTNLRRLTDADGYDAEGAYSPDGSKIVFCSTRDGYPVEKLEEEERDWMENDPSYFGEIYIMNADGSEQTRLTDWPGYDGGPFFSPTGERIVWRHFHPSGRKADIYTMRTDGSDRRRLTDLDAMSWAPYYHPSNEYVIFTTNKHGFRNFELYIVDVAGAREPVRVTDADGFDGLPVFAPSGDRICWTSNRTEGGKGQLFMADWDHEAARAAIEASPLKVGVAGETAED